MRAWLLSVLFIPCTAPAQSWCPPGATWTHDYLDNSPIGWHGVTRVVHEGDSMVGGFMAQKLRETNVIAPYGTTDFQSTTFPPMIMRYADGVVYTWNAWPGEFDTLMWFSAAPGQFWTGPGTDNDPYSRLTVLDTSTVAIDGVPLRQLLVERSLWEWAPPDTLRERIGFSFNYLNGWSWFLTDMPWMGLRCYRDAEIEFAAPWVTDCGFTLSAPESHDRNSIGLYPNPGNDQFTISLPTGKWGIEVVDALGRMASTRTHLSGIATIATEHLPSGPYLIRIEAADGTRTSVPWVKE